MLQSLQSADQESAEEALFHLRMKICHQGVAVSRETAIALPTLLDIVEARKTTLRIEVLRLVADISRSSHAWRRSAKNAQPQYAGNYTDKIEWETAVDRAFEDALPCLGRLESDADPEIAALAHGLAERHWEA
ncbi:hypothetical protein ACFOY4_02955 [Actinomadura syzygii]|uniref:hypothetical protein n=1 Tax=Actinomadura syzygii TaxID=1427538 RepID=UPI0011DD57B4|nr:hypothetical protein [Actinomadura syzygii]